MSTGETSALIVAVGIPVVGWAVSFGMVRGAVSSLRQTIEELRETLKELSGEMRETRHTLASRIQAIELEQAVIKARMEKLRHHD